MVRKKSGRIAAITSILAMMIITVFALNGCANRLTSNIRIENFGRINEVQYGEGDGQNAGNYSHTWVPDCTPEEEVAFVEFRANEDFGEIQVSYYKYFHWTEMEDANGKVVSETTDYAEDAEHIFLTYTQVEGKENTYRVEVTGLEKGQYMIRIFGTTDAYKKAFADYQASGETEKPAELINMEENYLEVFIKIGGKKLCEKQ